MTSTSSPRGADAPAHWTDAYFTPLYARFYEGPLFDRSGTREEVEFLKGVLEHAPKGPVLDIGCGFGRHLTPVARSGRRVVGLDRYRHLLARIPARGRRAVQGDMRRLPFADNAFAGAWCLFNTFGYFDDATNRAMLADWARVLVPGAPLVLQIPNRTGMIPIVKDFPPNQMLTANASLVETYSYDAESKSLVGKGLWMMGDQQQAWDFRLRLYTGGEIDKMLARAGFTRVAIREVFRHDDARFNARTSPQMVVTAWRGA